MQQLYSILAFPAEDNAQSTAGLRAGTGAGLQLSQHGAAVTSSSVLRSHQERLHFYALQQSLAGTAAASCA
jgi:hypothetical protein